MRNILLICLLPLVAACSTGMGRIQTAAKNSNASDLAVLGGIGYLVYEIAGRSVWEAETSFAGTNRYRVTLKRNRFADSGDGEAQLLFRQHAERIAATRACASWRIVEYQERYDSKLIGLQRVAEGLIECEQA